MSRGNSLVAGVVLIGLLGTVAVALQAATPTPEPSSPSIIAVRPASQVAAADAAKAKVTFTGKTLCTDPVKKDASESGAKVAGADKIEGEAEACVPGCTYKLTTTSSKAGAVTTVNAEKDDCEKFKDSVGGLKACRDSKECVVLECNASSKCEKVKLGLRETMRTLYQTPEDEEARAKQLAEYAKTNPIAAQNQALRESSELQKWFAEDVDKRILENADYIKENKDEKDPGVVSAVKDAKKENDNLATIKTKALAEGKTELVAPASPDEKAKAEAEAKAKATEKENKDLADKYRNQNSGFNDRPPGQQPPGQGQCSGISQMLGICSQNQQQQQQQQNYCVRSQTPLVIENRPASPGCLNYQQQQQCGLIQMAISGCPQNNPQTNPYGQQCRPQYYCVNNALYWGSPIGQQTQYQQPYQDPYASYYGYNTGYGLQGGTGYACPNQVVQQCQYGCMPATTGGISTQCASNPQQPGTGPTATISCGGKTMLDVGMKVPITFSCANAVTSAGSGFETGGFLSGSSTPTIQRPPHGTDMVSYGLTCTASNNQTATNRCDITINVASIVLVANPRQVAVNASSTIGWITKGMKTCVISSPDLPDFNEDNEDNTSTSGVAKTPPLTENTEFFLTCLTKSDQIKEASVIVRVDGDTDDGDEDDNATTTDDAH